MILLVLYAFLSIIGISHGSGYFEIQITKIKNSRGEVLDGNCCDGDRNAENVCTEQCDTFFRVCLKQYQNRITYDSHCTFGNITSPVYGSNSFEYPPESTRTRSKLPFDFAWTVSFTRYFKI